MKIAFLLRTREVWAPNLGPETGYSKILLSPSRQMLEYGFRPLKPSGQYYVPPAFTR